MGGFIVASRVDECNGSHLFGQINATFPLSLACAIKGRGIKLLDPQETDNNNKTAENGSTSRGSTGTAGGEVQSCSIE